jgi:hypothetical protein
VSRPVGAGPCLVYEIDVEGRLGETPLAASCGLRAECRGWHTVLRGALPDEAALHAVLAEIQGLGLAVLQFRRHIEC